MLHIALCIARRLKKYRVDAGVVDIYRLKPLNQKLFLKLTKGYRQLVTMEEHLLSGGLGSLIAEVLLDNQIKIPLKRIAIPDGYYYVYGSRKNIQSVCGIDEENILKILRN
jgi:transketolase